MDKFFSIFGKTVGILLIAAGLIGGGIYLGQKYFVQKPGSTTGQTAVSASPAVQANATPTLAQAQADPHVAINGGGISPFNKYLMSGFKSWTKTVDHSSTMDKLTLTFGDYQLTILQAALGGGSCTFPGEQPQAMGVVLSNPVADIVMFDGSTYKRGQADAHIYTGRATYTVCQKGPGGTYGTITSFGVINYVVPLNPDKETVAMMDAMIGSLQKQ